MSLNESKVNPYKLVIFGSASVGKSAITLRFVSDSFSKDYLPTIEDCFRAPCEVDGETAMLDILDTAGMEDYNALRDQWVQEGNAFLLVYSVTSRASFEDLKNFRDRIFLANDGDVAIVLVGNKIDLKDQRVISTEEGRALAQRYGNIPFVECSALTAENCHLPFQHAVRDIRRLEALLTPEPSSGWWCNVL